MIKAIHNNVILKSNKKYDLILIDLDTYNKENGEDSLLKKIFLFYYIKIVNKNFAIVKNVMLQFFR